VRNGKKKENIPEKQENGKNKSFRKTIERHMPRMLNKSGHSSFIEV
jgi:predicted component of type VI protein secretion system